MSQEKRISQVKEENITREFVWRVGITAVYRVLCRACSG